MNWELHASLCSDYGRKNVKTFTAMKLLTVKNTMGLRTLMPTFVIFKPYEKRIEKIWFDGQQLTSWTDDDCYTVKHVIIPWRICQRMRSSWTHSAWDWRGRMRQCICTWFYLLHGFLQARGDLQRKYPSQFDGWKWFGGRERNRRLI